MVAKKGSTSASEKENRARDFVRHMLSFALCVEPLALRDPIKGELRGEHELKEEIVADIDANDERFKSRNHDAPTDEILRAKCAVLIGDALPRSPWRDYAMNALCRPAPLSQKDLQRLRRNGKEGRDQTICTAVCMAISGGLRLSRNAAQRHKGGTHSACSLVADELKEWGLNCSEDAIEKIYRATLPRLGAEVS
jgi:hypothetical protein